MRILGLIFIAFSLQLYGADPPSKQNKPAGTVTADPGVKSQGKATNTDATEQNKPEQDETADTDTAEREPLEKRLSCFAYTTSTTGKKFFFSNKHVIYVLVNAGIKDKRNFKIPMYKHVVLKVDLREASLMPVPGSVASLPASALFLPHGNPPANYSGVVFAPAARSCQSGDARLFHSFSLKENKGKVSAFNKKISLIASGRITRLFDLVSRRILDMDVGRFQFRKLTQAVDKNELPLFAEPGRRMLYTFAETPNFRGIINRSGRRQEKLPFPAGTRVLQQGQLFGMSRLIIARNRLEIREFPKWTGSKAQKKRYLIELPGLYSISEAQIIIDFKTKLIALGAAVPLAKKKWRKIFFYDYRRGKVVAKLSIEPGLFPNTMAVDPFGLYMAVDVVRETDGKATYLALFNLKTRKLRKLALR